MDFQKFVDGFHSMTCIMSVEKLPDGKYGEIRIVTGNKAYIDSIENMPDVPQAFSNKFIPNSLYQNYFPQDPNFEFFIYNSAVLKKPMHLISGLIFFLFQSMQMTETCATVLTLRN